VGVIVGATTGAVVFVAALCLFFYKKRKRVQEKDNKRISGSLNTNTV